MGRFITEGIIYWVVGEMAGVEIGIGRGGCFKGNWGGLEEVWSLVGGG